MINNAIIKLLKKSIFVALLLERVREILNSRSGAVAVAGFGNIYWTDGPFMRYIATNPLPLGVKGVSVMINAGKVPEEHEGLFRLVNFEKTNAIIGKAGTLKNGAQFIIDGDIGASIETEDERTLELLPDNETITVSKSKWLVADGIKPAKVAYKKGEFIIIEGKKGAGIVNPSGLKLSYKAKDGSFNGSFTAYAIVKGKLKKHKATVEGILIGDVGYGTITIKNVGTWAVTIE